ncbi:MAG TPA: aspartate dehydrogenase [bacterium]|nr:aspartate dehydrogenase [bacterium]
MRVGIVGFGAVGQQIAAAMDRGVPGAALAAITSRDLDAARRHAERLLRRPPPVVTLADAVARSDLVVEAAPAAAFPEIARATLAAGKELLVLTVGALLDAHDAYVALARRHGGVIRVASGAIGGLDAIAAAAVGAVESVTMTTRKPPQGLAGAPYLAAHGIDLTDLSGPRVVFEGSAREAWQGFPANVNVSAAVSLAGIGPDRTRLRIVADPALDRNIHDVEVTGEFGRFAVHIENRPSANPRSGVLTALSVIATIRRLTGPLRVGG